LNQDEKDHKPGGVKTGADLWEKGNKGRDKTWGGEGQDTLCWNGGGGGEWHDNNVGPKTDEGGARKEIPKGKQTKREGKREMRCEQPQKVSRKWVGLKGSPELTHNQKKGTNRRGSKPFGQAFVTPHRGSNKECIRKNDHG